MCIRDSDEGVWAAMKVLVVGGSGFIGTRLISDWRAAGHELSLIHI